MLVVLFAILLVLAIINVIPAFLWWVFAILLILAFASYFWGPTRRTGNTRYW